MTYYIATYRPPYPEALHSRVQFNIYRKDRYSASILPATTTAVLRVDNVQNKQEAIAVALEYAAGRKVTVSKVLG